MSSPAHGLAHGLTQGWTARPCIHFISQLLSPLCVHMGFIIFMGITFLLHERVPCSSELRGVCAVAPHHLKFYPFRRVIFYVTYCK